MDILPSDEVGKTIDSIPAINLDSSYREAAQFLHERDATGGLLATVMMMDKAEDWVVSRLAMASEEMCEQVRVRQRRLSEILTQHRQRVQPDNNALVQLLSWMNSSESFYTLDYLTRFQPEFTSQFFGYCQANSADDISARLCRERIVALYRATLLSRVFSPASFDYLLRALAQEGQQ